MTAEMKTGWMSRLRETARGIWKEFRANGLRGVVRVYGWKLLLGVFLFYLIRDTVLYILIPLIAGTAIWKAIFP
ncbi:MAG: hypothetical protein AB1752_06080 [Candidatus Zixiibacteriota bacterium]